MSPIAWQSNKALLFYFAQNSVRFDLTLVYRDWAFGISCSVARSCPTHWKRPWCWERLRAGGEGDGRGWGRGTASPTRWTWVWASSGRWWRTGKPGVLQSMGFQRTGHDWVTEWQIPSQINIKAYLSKFLLLCTKHPVFNNNGYVQGLQKTKGKKELKRQSNHQSQRQIWHRYLN